MIYNAASWGQPFPLLGGSRDDVDRALAWRADGRMLASTEGHVIKVWDLTTRQAVLTLRGHADNVIDLSWSNDRRRLASASADRTVKVWEMETGQEVHTLREASRPVAWSPDSRQLAACSSDGTSVKVWDASPGYQARRRFREFSHPDSTTEVSVLQRSFFVLKGLGRYRDAERALGQALKEWERVVARFPDEPYYWDRLFTTRLLLAKMWGEIGRYAEAEQTYRQVLAEQIQFAAEAPEGTGRSLRVLDAAETRFTLGQLLVRMGRFRDAVEEYRQSIQMHISSGSKPIGKNEVQNDLAWLLLTCPDPQLHNPPQALELAKAAVESQPMGTYWNTLGVAHYRMGDRKAAIQALEQSMKLSQGGNSFDFFFLAMAHWQLGEKEQARKWYAKSVEWMDKNSPQNQELRRFRAEAAALLGITDASTTKGKEAFPKKE